MAGRILAGGGGRHGWRPRVVAVVVAVLMWLPAPAVGAQADDVAAHVSASGAVLWDPLDDAVLWGRQARRPRRMASTTKIMTTLLAVEAGTIDDMVTVSATADAADDEPGAATLGLRAGERIPMRSLLHGLMMRSGNDAAVAVAEHLAGSQDEFVDDMNARARQLGLRDTRFLDASGLTGDAGHHASPVDLARLAQRAMAAPQFADLVDDARAAVPGLGTLQSRNLLLGTYHGATGVKTGYTALAGQCLVASATRRGRTLYAVVLGSEDNFGDTTALLDHGFEDFTVISAASRHQGVYRTSTGAVDLRVDGLDDHTVPVAATVRLRSRLRPMPPADVRRGTRLGVAELVVDGEVVDTADLQASATLRRAAPATPEAAVGAAVQDAMRAFARATPRRTWVRSGGDRIVPRGS